MAFVADVVGTGSSRKSACNSLMWHIGEDIPFVPNKRRAGVVIGGLIAPIFFNTTEDSGRPAAHGRRDQDEDRRCHHPRLRRRRHPRRRRPAEISRLEVKPATLKDEFRAGGRLALIIGRQLTAKARKTLGLGEAPFFTTVENPKPKPDQGYTLAQKIVGRACGVAGVLPGTACEPHMTTVGSQDTTGPMTADELKELACLEFQADLFMQSFCHTAAYPKPADVKVHQDAAGFHDRPQGRLAQARRRGHPLLAEPAHPARHRRDGRRLPHPFPDRRVLPGRLGPGRLRRGPGLHAPRHARIDPGQIQRPAQSRHHPARRRQRHPLLRRQAGDADGREEEQEERLQRLRPRDRGPRGPDRRPGLRADRRLGRALGRRLRPLAQRGTRRGLPQEQRRPDGGDDRGGLPERRHASPPDRRLPRLARQADAPAARPPRRIQGRPRDRPGRHHRAARRLPQRSRRCPAALGHRRGSRSRRSSSGRA